MRIAIPIYPRFTATDAIGGYEVLGRVPGASVHFLASRAGTIETDLGLKIVADDLDTLPDPEIIMIPGGPNAILPLSDAKLLDWVRRADQTSQWTTSVCTGAYVLGAAGLLEGKRATTHWLDIEGLTRWGATPVRERVVFDGKLVTAGGVSSSLDMGLTLAARIAGEDTARAIQLGIEYDPHPPFDAGSPDKAPPHVVAMVRHLVALRS